MVAIDPASRAVHTRAGVWGEAGLAERDPAFDFFLIASVLPGHASPALVHERALSPRETSRNERIVAMTRHSTHHLDFLGTAAPMHMPA